ncbi:MAG: NADH:flavin oxidoreductase [Bdellovibrionales bacterium]
MVTRFTPYTFSQGPTSKNRVVVPPMASQTADSEGFATARTIQHYSRLAASGAGLIFAEYTFVNKSGRGEAHQLGADTDDKIVGLSRIAKVIQQSGALAGLQLVHVGGKTTRDLTGGPLMAPSAVVVPVKGWEPEVPEAMSLEDIRLWVDWFVAAAGRALNAGFDLVELHAAHGYGLNQWLSPLTNQRSDSYGGSIMGRSGLLVEIAHEIKSRFPDLLLAVRLPAQDHIEGGLTVIDMAWTVTRLEQVGVDLIDVSSGIGGWRRPEGRTGQGYLIGDAALLKAKAQAPVIGVGGIETGEFIDEILSARKVDFAAVGRAILHDPKAWGELNLSHHRRKLLAV